MESFKNLKKKIYPKLTNLSIFKIKPILQFYVGSLIVSRVLKNYIAALKIYLKI